jgi:uroporphyrinogen III methyltransferase/synthase
MVSLSKVDHSSQPLAGRTVVITRAREQANQFATELERYGARVISCPTIEIVEPESYALLDEAIDNLYGYDWLIFTSVNGVKYFLRRLAERGHETHELDDLRVCAIGESTAAALRDAQVHVDLVPEKSQAEGVYKALLDFLGGVDAFKTLNLLMPRATSARDYLPLALEEAGARIDVVPTYRTVKPRSSDFGRVAALIEGGAIDCVAFTSSSSVTHFAQLFDTHDLKRFLKGVAIACIGEITAATAEHLGLHARILPKEQTVAALAREIAVHFEAKEL